LVAPAAAPPAAGPAAAPDGTEGAETSGLAAGAGRGAAAEAKENPHTSQNCPVLGAPHCGQGSPVTSGAAGTAAAAGAAEAGDGAGTGATPPMRMPQMSQKSVLAESWPLGQVGMPPHLLGPDRLGRAGVQRHLVGVVNRLLQPHGARRGIDHV